MERSYEVRKAIQEISSHANPIQGAIRCLNSRKAAAKLNLDDMRGSDDMVEWLKLLGYSVQAYVLQ